MNDRIFLITFLAFFFIASVFLTMHQERLFRSASQDIVTAGYLNPSSETSTAFFIEHLADRKRDITLTYKDASGTEETQSITLSPQERREFSPSETVRSVAIRYQDTRKQEQTLTLYKK